MSSGDPQHLSCGALAALVQSESGIDKRFESHLEACSDCKQIYEMVKSFSRGSDFEKRAATLSSTCCNDDISDLEKAENFLTFLTSDISDEIAACYFNHVNHCLPCLVFFATNWSDYITTQNNSK